MSSRISICIFALCVMIVSSCESITRYDMMHYDGKKTDMTGEMLLASLQVDYAVFPHMKTLNDSILSYVMMGRDRGEDLLEDLYKGYMATMEYHKEEHSHDDAHMEEEEESVESSWYYTATSNVCYSDDKYISIDMSRRTNAYEDVLEEKRYVTWNVKEDKKAGAEDVFNDIEALRNMISMLYVEDGDILSSYDSVNHLPITDEFIIDDSGVTFLYKGKELDLYDGGYKEVFVPLHYIEELYKK